MRARPTVGPQIRRLPGPAHTLTPLQSGHTVYEITLTDGSLPGMARPLLRPPPKLTTVRFPPAAVSLHAADGHLPDHAGSVPVLVLPD